MDPEGDLLRFMHNSMSRNSAAFNSAEKAFFGEFYSEIQELDDWTFRLNSGTLRGIKGRYFRAAFLSLWAVGRKLPTEYYYPMLRIILRNSGCSYPFQVEEHVEYLTNKLNPGGTPFRANIYFLASDYFSELRNYNNVLYTRNSVGSGSPRPLFNEDEILDEIFNSPSLKFGNSEFKVGVEVELGFDGPWEDVEDSANEVQAEMANLGFPVNVQRDGSIRNNFDEYRGREFVSPPMPLNQLANWMFFLARCARTKRFNGNSSCGIHVHMSRENLPTWDKDTSFQVQRVIEEFLIQVEELELVWIPDSRINNTYCLNFSERGQYDDWRGKYCAVNIATNYETVEIRRFGHPDNWDVFEQNVDRLSAIVETAAYLAGLIQDQKGDEFEPLTYSIWEYAKFNPVGYKYLREVVNSL